MAFGLTLSGQSPDQGHSPVFFLITYGGAEPRLTSGGGAAAEHSPPAAEPQPNTHRGRRSRSRTLTAGGEAAAEYSHPVAEP